MRFIKIKYRNQKRNKEISDRYSNIKVQVSQVALKVTLFKKNMAAAIWGFVLFQATCILLSLLT